MLYNFVVNSRVSTVVQFLHMVAKVEGMSGWEVLDSLGAGSNFLHEKKHKKEKQDSDCQEHNHCSPASENTGKGFGYADVPCGSILVRPLLLYDFGFSELKK